MSGATRVAIGLVGLAAFGLGVAYALVGMRDLARGASGPWGLALLGVAGIVLGIACGRLALRPPAPRGGSGPR